jgi:hypothetical protein
MASSVEKQSVPDDGTKHWDHDSERGVHTIKPIGVRKAEAAQKVLNGKHKFFLFIRHVYFLNFTGCSSTYPAIEALGSLRTSTLLMAQLLGRTWHLLALL